VLDVSTTCVYAAMKVTSAERVEVLRGRRPLIQPRLLVLKQDRLVDARDEASADECALLVRLRPDEV
jgi:hypothetical protein